MARGLPPVLLTVLSVLVAACGGGGGDESPSAPRPAAHPSVVTHTLAAPAAQCPNGGIQVDAGIDDDGDGVLDPAEVDVTQYVCNGQDGADGLGALVIVTPEPPGTHCPAGGSLVSVGVDANRNATLDPAEVTTSTFVCAGAPGTPGPVMPVIQSLSSSGKVLPGGTVTATVTAQSAEGLALAYAWTVPAGWTVVSGGAAPTVAIGAPDVYDASGIATVTVTDTRGRVATGTLVLATASNLAPDLASLTAFPNPAFKGQPFTLEASALDLLGDGLGYAWTLPAGFTILSGQGTARITAVATAFASGSARVVVSDGHGGAVEGSLYVATADGRFGPFPGLLETFDGADSLSPRLALNAAGSGVALCVRAVPAGTGLFARHYEGARWTWEVLLSQRVVGEPDVAMDPAGNAFAVWRESGASPGVFASRYDVVSGTWSAPQRLDPATGSSSPRVAVDSSGNAVALWATGSTARTLYAARYRLATGTWGSPATVRVSAGDIWDSHQLGVDSVGNAVAVWTEYSAGQYAVLASRSPAATGGWGAAQILRSASASGSPGPRLAFDGAGNAVATWAQDSTQSIYASRLSASTGSWSAPQTIESAPGHASQPEITAVGAVDFYAAWVQYDATIANLYVSRYAGATGGWSPPFRLDADAETHAVRLPRIAADVAGNVAVVWLQAAGAPATGRLYSRRLSASTGTWGASWAFPSQEWSYPVLRMDASGNAVALWLDRPSAAGPVQVLFTGSTPTSTVGWASLVEWGFGTAGPPAVATGSGGDTIAAWPQGDGVFQAVYVSTRSVGQVGWGAPRTLTLRRDDHATAVSVAVNGAGHAFVAWGSGGQVWASRRDAATDTWTDPAMVSTVAALFTPSPRLGIDSEGNAVVTWLSRDRSGLSSVLVSRFSAAAGSWSTPQFLSPPATSVSAPELVVRPQGDAVVAWARPSAQGAGEAWTARLDPSTGTWGTPRLLGSATAVAYSPQLSADAAGNVVAVWIEFDGTGVSVVSNHLDAGAGDWGTAERVARAASGYDSPRLAVEPNGGAVVVWLESNSGRGTLLWGARRAAAGAWSAPHLLDGAPGTAGSPLLSADGCGNALVAWLHIPPFGSIEGMVARHLAGAGWTPMTPAEVGAGALAVDGSGNAVVVWSASTGSRSDLYWNEFR